MDFAGLKLELAALCDADSGVVVLEYGRYEKLTWMLHLDSITQSSVLSNKTNGQRSN